MEIIRELDNDNLKQLKKVFDDWLDSEFIPDEELQARIALIFV